MHGNTPARVLVPCFSLALAGSHMGTKSKLQFCGCQAEEEFNIEKLRLVEQEKVKVRTEYERKQKQVEIQRFHKLRFDF
jgi:hypothetical protein